MMLGAVTGFGVLIKTIILPALFASTMLSLINCLTEKNYVNQLSKLIRNAAVDCDKIDSCNPYQAFSVCRDC